MIPRWRRAARKDKVRGPAFRFGGRPGMGPFGFASGKGRLRSARMDRRAGASEERIFRNARIDSGGSPVDLRVARGRFAEIAPNLENAAGCGETDLGGRVALPAFVESHIHLDKAFLEERAPNLSGSLADAIAVTLELKRSVTKRDMMERAERALRMAMRHGAGWFRAQVEVDPVVGLRGMEVALELREKYSGLADFQLVVFPQEGIEQRPGTEELMREAMRMGGDLVGGIPYNDLDPERHLDVVFGMAEAFGCGLDFHLDFSDSPADRRIESVAARTIAAGLQGRVAVGHLTSLGSMEDAAAAPLIEKILEADISVLPLPATDLFLGGRGERPPRFRGLAPVKSLLDAGVNVAISSNNVRNAFTPSGRGDLLELGLLLAHALHMSGAAERGAIPALFTTNGARALGVEEDYGLRPGRAADFVVLDSANFGDVLIDQPEKRFVVKGGRVIVENVAETTWRETAGWA